MKKGKHKRRDITWEIMDMDRTEAIILIDGKMYSSELNHQGTMLEYATDYWKSMNIDIDEETGMGMAIRHTDQMFRENKMFGFDVMESLDEKYLISHYPQSLENKEVLVWAENFAKANGMMLGTFESRERFSDKAYVFE